MSFLLRWGYSMPRPSVPRGRLSTAVASIALLGVLGSITPVGAEDEIEGLREQREELAREAAEVAAEIDKLDADDQAVVDALAALDEYISLQQSRIEAADVAIAAAEADANWPPATKRICSMLEMEAILERMRQRAIDAFVQPRSDVVSHLANDDLTETVVKSFLLDTVVGSEIDSVDEYREAEALKRGGSSGRPSPPPRLAEEERSRQQERLAELEVARIEAEAVRAEVQRRIDEWEAVGDEIDAADREPSRPRSVASRRSGVEPRRPLRRAAAEAARRAGRGKRPVLAAEEAGADLPDVDFGDFSLTTVAIVGCDHLRVRATGPSRSSDR